MCANSISNTEKKWLLLQSLSAFPQKHLSGLIPLTKVLPYLGPDHAEEELHLVIAMQFHHRL